MVLRKNCSFASHQQIWFVGRGHGPADHITNYACDKIVHMVSFFGLDKTTAAYYGIGGVMTPPYKDML